MKPTTPFDENVSKIPEFKKEFEAISKKGDPDTKDGDVIIGTYFFGTASPYYGNKEPEYDMNVCRIIKNKEGKYRLLTRKISDYAKVLNHFTFEEPEKINDTEYKVLATEMNAKYVYFKFPTAKEATDFIAKYNEAAAENVKLLS